MACQCSLQYINDLIEIVVHKLDTVIDTMYLGSYHLMFTPYNFLSSKVRFIHTSTVIGSHSSSGKKLRVRLAYILFVG